MPNLWIDNPRPTHLSPDQMLAAHMRTIMYSSGIHNVPFYPKSPYGMGDLDCSNLSYPPDPNYENCAPSDSACVARNGAANDAHNVAVQAYHDAIAACSAQKYVSSGGTLTPSALTYGAAQDLLTNTQTTDTASSPAMATTAQASQLAPMYTPPSSPAYVSSAPPGMKWSCFESQPCTLVPITSAAPPAAAPTPAPNPQPGNVPANAGVTPASQTVPPAALPPAAASGGSSGSSQQTGGTGLSSSALAIVAALGIGALFLFGGKGGR